MTRRYLVEHTTGFEHDFYDPCFSQWYWCRIHRYPDWSSGVLEHEHFPASFNVLSSRHGWQKIGVHCGPGAFYPSRKSAGLK